MPLRGPSPGTVPPLPSPALPPPAQDTADYVKPVAFSVEYSLEDPDHGPMLDDGWPTTLRVSVRPGTEHTTPEQAPAAPLPPDLGGGAAPKEFSPCTCPQTHSTLPPTSLWPVLNHLLRGRTRPSLIGGPRIPAQGE